MWRRRLKIFLLKYFDWTGEYKRCCQNCEFVEFDQGNDGAVCLNPRRGERRLPEKHKCRHYQLDLWLKYDLLRGETDDC